MDGVIAWNSRSLCVVVMQASRTTVQTQQPVQEPRKLSAFSETSRPMGLAHSFGPLITPDGVTFRLWAPAGKQVELLCRGTHSMKHAVGGWFDLNLPEARAGDRYQFSIDGKPAVPDPASHFQPDDVHGASEVIDHSTYRWRARDWAGRPWHECVFLELHVGTFSGSGTFHAAIERLDHVVACGFTAIELMPVADFPGRWNWGYDGVLLYAPDSTYGRPDDLKELIDAAHQRGLMVFLDVVYNHFGPDGNYLGQTAPQFFLRSDTPWGLAIDYTVAEVRRFAVQNALLWLRDFRFDGLRLDAVHAIPEPGRGRLLHDMSEAAGQLAAQTGRYIHLVLENDANQSKLLDPTTDPAAGKYRAQWNDDYHHAFHVMLTKETHGYYSDYDAETHVGRSVGEGFVYQGQASSHRQGTRRGDETSALPATAFVNFLQNHDQIGNRALGQRLSDLAPRPALEGALALLLLSPSPPLLFMGDEWDAREPFPFFCDFKGDLAEAVRQGRRREFAGDYAQHGDTVPDPLSEQTVQLARLDWDARNASGHSDRLDLVRRLLAARKAHVMPMLPELQFGHARVQFETGVLGAVWSFRSGRTLALLANFSDESRPRPPSHPQGKPIWGGDAPPLLSAWTVHAVVGGA